MRGRKIGVRIYIYIYVYVALQALPLGEGGFPRVSPIKESVEVYLEYYTSVLGVDKAKLEEFYQKPLVLVDREYVQSRAEEIYRLLATRRFTDYEEIWLVCVLRGNSIPKQFESLY